MAIDASTRTLTISRSEDTTFRFRVKVKATGSFETPNPAEFTFHVDDRPQLTRNAKADPGDPTSLFFEFSEADAIELGSRAREYRLIRSQNGKDRKFLHGKIVAEGFAL